MHQRNIKVINNSHNGMLKWTVFKHWKSYVNHKKRTRNSASRANSFYRKKVQKRIMNVLSRNVLLKWQHIVGSTVNVTEESKTYRNQDETENYSTEGLRRHFVHWSNYSNIQPEKKQLLKNYMKLWKMYITQRKCKKNSRKKINEMHKFYEKILLRKYIRAWMKFVFHLSKKLKLEFVNKHFNKKCLKRYFHSWIAYRDIRVQNSNVKEWIQKYSRHKLLKKYLNIFAVYVNEMKHEKELLQVTKEFYETGLKKRIVSVWKEWYAMQLRNAEKVNTFRSLLYFRTQRALFDNWKFFIFCRKCTRRKKLLSENLYKRKLMVKGLKRFQSYAIYRKTKKVTLDSLKDRTTAYIHQILNVYIEKWRKSLYAIMQEKRTLNQAVEFSEVRLLRKYFHCWYQYFQQYNIHSIRKTKLKEIAVKFLLMRFMTIWRARYQEVLEIRKKEVFIINTIQYKMTKRYLGNWKEYIRRKTWKKENVKRAKEFHKNFILREGLKEIIRISLHNIDKKYEIQLRNAAMRFTQNLYILKHFFEKWHSLIYPRRKCRYVYSNISDSHLADLKVIANSSCLVLPEYMQKNVGLPQTTRLFGVKDLQREGTTFDSC